MNILILGGGGREHALAWAIRQNPKCDRLFVAPGNAGIAAVAECARLNPNSRAEVLEFAQENAVDFVIDRTRGAAGRRCLGCAARCRFLTFGPREAAQLEASKAFTRKSAMPAAPRPPPGALSPTPHPPAIMSPGKARPLSSSEADGLAAGQRRHRLPKPSSRPIRPSNPDLRR